MHLVQRTQRRRQARKMRVMMTKARSQMKRGQVPHTAHLHRLPRPSRDLEMWLHTNPIKIFTDIHY